jgi:hypothetical protein
MNLANVDLFSRALYNSWSLIKQEICNIEIQECYRKMKLGIRR